jgi:hypothetical protein
MPCVLAALFFLSLMSVAAGAEVISPTPLVVGSVRDQAGEPPDASVEVSDAAGKTIGLGHTNADGTFAVGVQGQPSEITVRCRFCAVTRTRPDGTAPLVIIVRRYAAIFQTLPSQEDLAALPYSDLGSALALAPYVLPIMHGMTVTDISDRGLDRGKGLIIEDGVPVYNSATGRSGIEDMPAHYASASGMQGPENAFLYGGYAAGGTFILTPRTQETSVALEEGVEPALAVHAHSDDVFADAGISKNAYGDVRKRADLAYDTDFLGGRLDISGADGSVGLERIAYTTSSRKYRTFAEVSANNMTNANGALAHFQIEHPDTVTLIYGVSVQQLNAEDSLTFSNAHIADDTAYVQAKAGNESASFNAGASLAQIGVTDAFSGIKKHGDAQTGQFSLDAQMKLGRSFRIHADASTSARAPTLYELNAQAQPNTPATSRLLQGALSYEDARRIRMEVIVFHEALNDVQGQDTQGIGTSLVWQLAPLVTLRAWTLHNTVNQAYQYDASSPYTPIGAIASGRSVLWSTYDNPSGARFDMMFHRDAIRTGAVVDMDGDILLPVTSHIKLAAGSYRASTARFWSLGLRLYKN